MLGGADNPNGELPSYITGADSITDLMCEALLGYKGQRAWRPAEDEQGE
ncbi:hypothetical protein GLZ12_22250 [Salmonella enterica]|nr:hypothetical protein [Salmonella enterica]